MNDIDIVYLYKRTNSDELRYSMRSLENVPHRHVFVVGDAPNFPHRNLTVIRNHHQGATGQDITTNHLRRVAAFPDIADRFYLFNDDFFVLDPIEDEIPLLHRGPTAMFHQRYDHAGLPTAGDYLNTEQATGASLAEKYAVPTPLSYALHVPMPMNKSALGAILETMPAGLRPRTYYGNLDVDAHHDGGYYPDCKIRRTDVGLTGLLSFVSTYDKSFRHGLIGKELRAYFNFRSPYEHD